MFQSTGVRLEKNPLSKIDWKYKFIFPQKQARKKEKRVVA